MKIIYNKDLSFIENQQRFNPFNNGVYSCKECGFFILYPNTCLFTDSKDLLKISRIVGTSAHTVKFNKHHSVCWGCLLKHDESVLNMNVSRLFNTPNKFISYCFCCEESEVNNKKKELTKTLENYIMKHGVDLGTEKYEHYVNLQARKNTYEYKRQKYGWSESDFKKFNKSRGVTVENCINRHGVVKGMFVYNSYITKQSNSKKFTTQISNLGIVYAMYIQKSKSNNAINMLTKRGINKQSKIAIRFFDELYERLKQYNIEIIYNTNKQSEYYLSGVGFFYYIDGAIVMHKMAVEFYGDLWHANPQRYKQDDLIPILNKTAKQIWNKDLLREQHIKSLGWDLIYIWESEYISGGFECFFEKLINKIK